MNSDLHDVTVIFWYLSISAFFVGPHGTKRVTKTGLGRAVMSLLPRGEGLSQLVLLGGGEEWYPLVI